MVRPAAPRTRGSAPGRERARLRAGAPFRGTAGSGGRPRGALAVGDARRPSGPTAYAGGRAAAADPRRPSARRSGRATRADGPRSSPRAGCWSARSCAAARRGRARARSASGRAHGRAGPARRGTWTSPPVVYARALSCFAVVDVSGVRWILTPPSRVDVPLDLRPDLRRDVVGRALHRRSGRLPTSGSARTTAAAARWSGEACTGPRRSRAPVALVPALARERERPPARGRSSRGASGPTGSRGRRACPPPRAGRPGPRRRPGRPGRRSRRPAGPRR